jgi:hypothetical protein
MDLAEDEDFLVEVPVDGIGVVDEVPQDFGVVRGGHDDVGSKRPPALTPLPPRTVLHMHRTLSKALKQATDDGLIPHNGASPVKPPHSTIAGAQTLYGAQDIRNMLLEIITPWSLATSRNIKAVPTDVSPVTVPTRV